MKFGLFTLMPHRDAKKSHRAVFSDATEMVKLAEQMNFDIAWFAEHHFSNYCLCPSPLMMAAHCAGFTRKIRLGTAVVVVPLYHPARLIEEIALVDILSDGRLALGLGSGYQDYEFQRFSVQLSDSKKLFTETLDVIEMAFSKGEYAYDGAYIKMPPTPIAIRPLQTPMPPIYIAGLYGDEEIQRRIINSGHIPFATAGWKSSDFLARFRTKYDETAKALGRNPKQMPFAVQRYVYITDSRDDALAAADHIRYTGRVAQSMRNKYFELDGSFLRELPAREEPTLEEIVDNAIIGDVETCIEKAIREIEILQPSHFSCFMQFGGLDIKKALRSMEQFGARVIPALEKHFGGLSKIGSLTGESDAAPTTRSAASGTA